jgi:hypothetical protein
VDGSACLLKLQLVMDEAVEVFFCNIVTLECRIRYFRRHEEVRLRYFRREVRKSFEDKTRLLLSCIIKKSGNLYTDRLFRFNKIIIILYLNALKHAKFLKLET